jgi:hypothetical protein
MRRATRRKSGFIDIQRRFSIGTQQDTDLIRLLTTWWDAVSWQGTEEASDLAFKLLSQSLNLVARSVPMYSSSSQ